MEIPFNFIVSYLKLCLAEGSSVEVEVTSYIEKIVLKWLQVIERLITCSNCFSCVASLDRQLLWKCFTELIWVIVAKASSKSEGHLNLGVFWQSKKGGWTGRRRGEKWWESEQGLNGKEGGKMREKGWLERGPKAHSKNSGFGIPYDLGTL